MQKRWYLRLFGNRIADPRLWALHRRTVTLAFGFGLAISFIPLPIHMIVAGLIAVSLRLNIPAIYGATLLVNPLTCVPLYYTAYRIGTTLLGESPGSFHFSPTWEWFESLQPVWKPFLLGCMVSAICTGLAGWLILEIVWRWRVTTKYRTRHEPSAA